MDDWLASGGSIDFRTKPKPLQKRASSNREGALACDPEPRDLQRCVAAPAARDGGKAFNEFEFELSSRRRDMLVRDRDPRDSGGAATSRTGGKIG
jgi:hypothetical protein